MTTIGEYAFVRCAGLTSVAIPSGVTTIGQGTFSGCTGLTNITVDAGNPNYASANGVLYNKAMTTLIRAPGALAGQVNIPDGVITIGACAFDECRALTGVTIPDSVTTIGNEAFRRCSSLTSITIPNSVATIGWSVFQSCNALASVTVFAAMPPLGGIAVFDYTHASLQIYVPADSVDAYKAAAGWSEYASAIQAIP